MLLHEINLFISSLAYLMLMLVWLFSRVF
uniref:Uncharacterized protein n=1 Tax=Anguilla anguilla TaxID=7936 RepID=A0A0E9QAL2_ANGAN